MRPRALGLVTDLALWRARGEVIDRGDLLVVSTPDDPGYYRGNLLVMAAPPQVGELPHWRRRFAAELGGRPGVRHVAFAWDDPAGGVGAEDELRAAGFHVEVQETLVATPPLAAPPAAATFAARELTADEVLATHELAWQLGDRHDESFRAFLRRRAAWQRGLVERGQARFWGVDDGGALVASAGLVRLGELGRFQDVQTAPAYRRRGLATAVLAAAAAAAVDDGAARLVLVAEADGDAARLYRRLGFHVVERTAWAWRA